MGSVHLTPDSQQPVFGPTAIFFSYRALQRLGVTYSRVHLRRLVDAGKFPPPVRLSANRIAWRISDIEAWQRAQPIAWATKASMHSEETAGVEHRKKP